MSAKATLAELRDAAMRLAARGYPVFPLVPGTKVPAVPNGFKAATCDPEVIGRWWARTPYNLGLATGPAGLVVIDLDTPKPGAVLPPGWAAACATAGTCWVSWPPGPGRRSRAP